MRVAAWNVNRRKLDNRHIAVFQRLRADTVLLNEFVDGKFRKEFEADLREAGYQFLALSNGVEGKKSPQVFAASKHKFETGDLRAPDVDEWSRCNFLHLKFETIEMVGIRVPCYEKNKKEEAAKIPDYWNKLGAIFETVRSQGILFAGDFNTDPDQVYGNREERSAIESALRILAIPSPEGDWSFSKGASTSRIDHVAHSSSVEVLRPRYESTVDGQSLAGEPGSLSDHAALVFEIS